LVVQLWWLVQATLFRGSPQFAYGFRRWLLRLFGTHIGPGVLVRPSAKITYPWKVVIGPYCWIGDDVVLYSLGEIVIGEHAVVSQGTYVCAADHDHAQADFPIRARPIRIGAQAWLGTGVFVGPGVSVGDATVIGACSAVFRDMPAATICMGVPCRPFKPRPRAGSFEE
jgi:putative colanic acid biosynthesis acetyltransferase WcaF